MLVELRNLPGTLDPALISVTEDGEPVADLQGQLIADAAVRPGRRARRRRLRARWPERPIEAAKAAAKSFVAQKRPEDLIALVAFADDPVVLSGFTDDAGRPQRADRRHRRRRQHRHVRRGRHRRRSSSPTPTRTPGGR